MIEFEEYKSKLNDLKPKLEELRAAFVPQSLLDELERLHAMAEAPASGTTRALAEGRHAHRRSSASATSSSPCAANGTT